MCDEFCVRIAPRDEQCVLGCCPGRTGWGQLPPLGWHLIGLLSAFGCLSLSSLPSLSATVSMSLSCSIFVFFFLLSPPLPTPPPHWNALWSHLPQSCRLSVSLSLSLPLNLSNSRGIDWWLQPLISPPSSYLLFSQTLTHWWSPGGFHCAATNTHIWNRRQCWCIITS